MNVENDPKELPVTIATTYYEVGIANTHISLKELPPMKWLSVETVLQCNTDTEKQRTFASEVLLEDTATTVESVTALLTSDTLKIMVVQTLEELKRISGAGEFRSHKEETAVMTYVHRKMCREILNPYPELRPNSRVTW